MDFQETRHTVLIVEDSTTFSNLLQRRISQTLGLPTLVAGSLAEAKELVSDHFDEIFVALLDLNLRLGEGTGALLAAPLVRAAAALLSDVASLDDVMAGRL